METLTKQSLWSWFAFPALLFLPSLIAQPLGSLCASTKPSHEARYDSRVPCVVGKVSQLHDVAAIPYVPANIQRLSFRNLMERACPA